MSLERLSFLKRYAIKGKHYNFDEEVNKIKEPVYADLNQLKNFTDEELNNLKPVVKIHHSDLNNDGGYFTLFSKAKSKVVLPNMIAQHLATNHKARIEPHHHVFMKMGNLTSESLRDVCLAIPKKRVWTYGVVDTIPVEALHHPNLTKEHAEEIVNSAREARNPYLNQMERQLKKRYNK